MIDTSPVELLRGAVQVLQKDPQLIHHPEIAFFRDFLVNEYKAQLPPKTTAAADSAATTASATAEDQDDEAISANESDSGDEALGVAADDENEAGRIPPEADDPPAAGNEEQRELTEEEELQLNALKEAAAVALEQGDCDKALSSLSAALNMGNASAMLYARRAHVLLAMKRPVACIADCDRALKLNADNGRAYRLRGKAYRSLGEWELASSDLATAQKLDWDEETEDVCRFVSAKWSVIRQAQLARERRRAARNQRNIQRAKRRGAAIHKKFGPQAKLYDFTQFRMEDMFPHLLNNEKLQNVLHNQKILAALSDAMANPANLTKYMNDPEIMDAWKTLVGCMGGNGGSATAAATDSKTD